MIQSSEVVVGNERNVRIRVLIGCDVISIISVTSSVEGAQFSSRPKSSDKEYNDCAKVATTCTTYVDSGSNESWIPPEAADCHNYEVNGLEEHDRATKGPSSSPTCPSVNTVLVTITIISEVLKPLIVVIKIFNINDIVRYGTRVICICFTEVI